MTIAEGVNGDCRGIFTRSGLGARVAGVPAELDMAVRKVVRECMSVSPGEEVLVVCNPATEEIGALMRIEAQGDGASATLAVISERDSHAAEPPRAVAAA